jgi:nitroreductase
MTNESPGAAAAEVVEPDIFACIGTQRAMRRLKPDPVPEAYIEKILWAGTRAPSGANRQPWRFVVVRDPARKRRLGELYARSFFEASGDFMAKLPADMPADARARAERTYRSARHLAEHMHEAPYIVLVCALPMGHDEGTVGGGSVFPAVQNMLLAARALGLGAAITTVVKENVPAVKELLRIPGHADIAAQLAFGWPVGNFGAGPRKPVEAVTYWDEWKPARA